MGLEMQNSAAEIKLRAERRAGEMLQSREKYTGRPSEKASQPVTLSKLKELNVSRMQSHRWQTIAALPEKEFEGYVQGHKESRKEITTAGALKLAKPTARFIMAA